MRSKEQKKFLKDKYFVFYVTPEGEEKTECCDINRVKEICKNYNLDRQDLFVFAADSEISLKNLISDDLIEAEFTSVWDGGVQVTAKCKVNPLTKEIVEIETVDVEGLDCLDEEYVYIEGKKYPAYRDDEYGGIGLYYE